jgi:hypothetical protein
MIAHISRHEWVVVWFNLIFLLIGGFASIRTGNIEFVLYVIVLGILLAIVTAIHFIVRFRIVTLWGLSLWGIAHMAGGLMPVPSSWPTAGEGNVLYNLWLIPDLLKFDQLVHAYGFGLVTWVCWQCLEFAFRTRGVLIDPTLGLLTLCVAGGIGFGAVNEVVEFIATLALPDTNVGGYVNTGWDLVSNLVGSLLAAIVIYWCSRSKGG